MENRDSDPAAMDIYDLKATPGLSIDINQFLGGC
jgi:hypothetical protein